MPAPGKYEGIADFIHRNSLENAFREAVSGDRTIERYLDDYPESRELTLGILSDLSASEEKNWSDRAKFGNGHTKKFKFN
jgi:hypothetical protein